MSFAATINGSSGCNCCGGGGVCGLLCSTRGGIAALCGWPEFGTPSSPPKAYRVGTMTGTVSGNLYDLPDCTILDHSDSCTFSSVCSYDKATCAQSSSGGTQCEVNGGDLPPSPPSCGLLVGTCNYSLAVTKVQQKLTPTGVCCGPEGSEYRKASGSQTFTLSQEDTEADAIDRILAGPHGIWSDFGPSAQCEAQYQERTSGFNFGYIEAKYKITAYGLVSFSDYSAKVTLYRRPYGVGDFEVFEERTSTITADENGFYEGPEETVTNDEGFETYAGACSIGSVF